MSHIIDVHAHAGLRIPDVPEECRPTDLRVTDDGSRVFTHQGITIVQFADVHDQARQYQVCKDAGVTHRVVSQPMQLNNFVKTLTSCSSADLAKRLNDRGAAFMAEYPDMIRMMATINPLEPKDNLPELDRCLDELGFSGIVVEPSWLGKMLDEPEFFTFWEHIEGRDVPVFMHPPMIPTCHLKMDCYRLEETVGRPSETALCVARMLSSGLFDRFPKLRIVLAHMGGGLMPVLGRLDMGHRLGYQGYPEGQAAKCELTPSEYIRRNLNVDTMGFSPPTIRQAIEVFGPDRVMFGSDYSPVPISPVEHVDIVKALGLSPDDEAKVLWRNANQFFGLELSA